MRSFSMRFVYVLVALFLVGFICPRPAAAQLPSPSQPILVVQDSTSSDPYQNFVPELLKTEGLNGYQTAQLSALTASFLTNYDVVVLPHLALTAAEVTLFQNYVNAGGTLVGFRPDQQLASVFGVNTLGTTLADAWMKIDTTTPYGSGLVSQVIKFHGTADNYSLLTATSLATLYQGIYTPTSSPAATVNSYGSGKAILFAFDLTQSVVLLRQGNPAWAGYPNNHDGFNTLRASQMFMDQASGKFWNDLGDGTLNDIPQADEQMRLFSNGVTLLNAAKRPLPRFWYFPNQARALVLMTGDHHGDPSSNSTSEISAVNSAGGAFQEFLWMDPVGAITPSQVQGWQSSGNTFGVHFDDTGEVDSSGVGGSHATWAGMNNVISTDLAALTNAFPTVSNPPISNRNHFLIWVSNNAAGTPDQTAQAELFQNFGIQMDTSFSAFPSRWGYMNGSGLPMKFLNTTNGTVIPVYEQSTQYEDDIQLGVGPYSLQWDLATAQTHYQKSLSDSMNQYNTVVTFLFHPDHWVTVDSAGNGDYQTKATTALQYAQSNGIPMLTADNWDTFWSARSAATFSLPSFSSSTLSFTVTANSSATGLSLLVPEQSGSKVVSTFKVDGTSQTFSIMNLQGIMYASVVVTPGSHSVSVAYTTAGTISGTISPTAAASSTTIQVVKTGSSTVTQTVSPAANGTYTVGPFPAGTYTVTPSSSGYTFSPTSRSVTLTTSNVTSVNFTGTAKASTGETIFTTQTPSITNGNDGVAYELGTAFTSDIAGQITGIRFWKADGETGTHTGHIWSSSGQSLALVTFSNETASGWQQQNLSSPLSIAANTQYVVTVNTGSNFYVDTNNGLGSQVINADLSTVVGSNGLYGTAGQFPTNSYAHSNYFRDIVFSPVNSYGASGTISPVAGGAGATVTLSGAGSGTATADSSGNFSFSGLSAGTYTVTPSLSGYTYSPTSQNFTVSSSNIIGLNFTATPLTYSLTGTISPAASGSNATVTLSGAGTGSTTANSQGVYTFTGLANGTYTLTPSKTGFVFTPTSLSPTVNGANVTGQNFTAAAAYSITGTISGGGGNGATVTLSGSGNQTVTANSSGAYTFTGVVAGSYTVTPTNAGYTFNPANKAVTVSTSNVTGVNFASLYSISGTVSGGGGATVTLSGAATGTVTANGSGAYSFTGLSSGNYTVTPSLSGTTFTPTNASVTISTVSVSGVNFSAVVQTYSITGTISGSGGNGATLALTGSATATTTANGSGVYTFSGLSNGSYTVTPSATNFTFTPANALVSISGASVSGVNFTANPVVSQTLFTTQTPGQTGDKDGSTTYELGTVFQSAASGQITAVRFWKDSNETGTHTGHIWSASGTLLATVTFSGETASGWQQQALSIPLSIVANTTYVVSVNTGNGYYVDTPSGLASTITNQNLSSVVGNNGVFGTVGQFPTGSWNNSNYFRDVVFTAGTSSTPFVVSGAVSPAAASSTTLTLTGGANGFTTPNASGNYSFSGLPNGTYTVTPTAAAYTFSPSSASVTVNGANATVTTFTASAVTSQTLFTTQTPAQTGNKDGSTTYELGTVFQSAASGQITAVRFWKDSNETGTHTGHIWSASGTLLATVTFSGETASGWQQQALSIPLSIVANTTYVVSVNTGNGYYVDTANGLASKITNLSLSSVVGNNGVFGTVGQFPTGSWNSSNYFRDVVFSAGTSSTPFVVSGTISPSAAATATTMVLTGGANGFATPDASGNYSFGGLPNGTYTVTPTASGYTFSPVSQTITISGSNVTGTNFTGSSGETIFTTQTPAVTGASDAPTLNYELGTVFTSGVAGQITAIRFWKDSNETGTHTGHIWSASGTLLATTTFTGETASGWQVQSLSTPLSITANTQYVVSVNTGNSYFVDTNGGLATQIVNGDLKTVVGSNGVFGTPGQFPTGSWENSNYFRDVTFVP